MTINKTAILEKVARMLAPKDWDNSPQNFQIKRNPDTGELINTPWQELLGKAYQIYEVIKGGEDNCQYYVNIFKNPNPEAIDGHGCGSGILPSHQAGSVMSAFSPALDEARSNLESYLFTLTNKGLIDLSHEAAEPDPYEEYN